MTVLRTLMAAVVLLALAAGTVAPPPGAQAAPPRPTSAQPPKECGPNDRPETGLQGQVPWPDRLSGRAAEGYNCNLQIVGEFESAAFANFDSYRNCVYYTDNPGSSSTAEGGGVVLDVSDPTNPKKTDYLTARAMGNAGESLKVNQKRGLLVANHYNTYSPDEGKQEVFRSLAVYDLKKDCRHPKLLADVIMPDAEGHEGCFQPDGKVYYMAGSGGSNTITPIDLTNPRKPRQLSAPWPLATHGCSISDDGNRGYFAALQAEECAADGNVRPRAFGLGGMLIVDTSNVQKLRRDAGFKIISCFPTPDHDWAQASYPLSYDGDPYVFHWNEFQQYPCPTESTTNFSYGHMIDIGNEKKPKEVSKVQTEVMLPENCPAVAADRGPQTQGLAQRSTFFAGPIAAFFGYDMHYCRPDRLHQPTIMGCANFASGLRVFDIRDPRHPKEIAYYNTGTLRPTNPLIDLALSPPVIRRDLGMIFWVTTYGGFHAAKFRDGVWPFKGEPRCPSGKDYFAKQYDMGWKKCRRGNS